MSESLKGRPAWNKGIPRTDDVKRKISESHKGKIPWNKGIPRTDKAKKNISKSLKGSIPWNVGIAHSVETKRKISDARLKNPCPESYRHVCSQDARDKISKANSGHVCSEKTKQKISDALKGGKQPPRTEEYCRKQSEAQKGKVLSEQTRKKLSVAGKNRKWSDKTRGKLTGENSPHWKGGISFEPYCHKFNNKFRELIRDKFNRECFLCGKTEICNGKRLCVHHVNYDKNCLCNEIKCEFVPLCMNCHSKTNNNREYYETLITEQLIKYNDL